jgi:hypothetical protein
MALDLKGETRERPKYLRERRDITKENTGQLLSMQNLPYDS